MNTIEMSKKDTEVLSVERYMSLTDSEKNNIQSVKIIPPRFDNAHENDFGRILVRYKTSVYKMEGIF